MKNRFAARGTKTFFLVLALTFLLHPSGGEAFEVLLKTQKLKVGDKAPDVDPVRKPLEEKRPIVLVLLPSMASCGGCDLIMAALDEAEKKHPDMAFIRLGGEDETGAMDEDTILVKRLYGFVNKGEAMTFYIDNSGKLRKITLGRYNGSALEGIFDELKWSGW